MTADSIRRFADAILFGCSTLLVAVCTLSAVAAPLTIVSYSLENGESGSQTYYDDTYGGTGASGNPNVSGSFLSGGLGQLTNAAFAVPNDIFDDEWIGWVNIQPTITVDLGSAYTVNMLGFHASNWSPPFNDVGVFGSATLSYSLDNVTYAPLGNYLTTVPTVAGTIRAGLTFRSQPLLVMSARSSLTETRRRARRRAPSPGYFWMKPGSTACLNRVLQLC